MIKFLLAKQTFKSRLVQSDIKDVLEQYQIGHSSILYRIKEIQNDLDLLVGNVGHNSKRLQESKTSLISRIDKLEQINKDIDKKLDNQIACIKKIHFECLSIQSSNDRNKIRNRDNIRERRNSMI
jgi:potassium voltage-gated channel KQT-like subfamily protein